MAFHSHCKQQYHIEEKGHQCGQHSLSYKDPEGDEARQDDGQAGDLGIFDHSTSCSAIMARPDTTTGNTQLGAKNSIKMMSGTKITATMIRLPMHQIPPNRRDRP